MPRKKRPSIVNYDDFDEDFDDELSSNDGHRNLQLPVQRNAANARERARMRVLSSAFCRLKTKLPWVPVDTKLSKLDTLRLATVYIQQLRATLSDESDTSDSSQTLITNTQSLVWPFSFQQQNSNGMDNRPSTTNVNNLSEWITISSDYYKHSNSMSNCFRNGNNYVHNNSTAHG